MHATSCSTRPKCHLRVEKSPKEPRIMLSAEALDDLVKEAKRLRAVVARCRTLIEKLNSAEA